MATESKIKAKSFIGWVGGKSQLTSTIIPLIPDHKAYVEVFAGGSVDAVSQAAQRGGDHQ